MSESAPESKQGSGNTSRPVRQRNGRMGEDAAVALYESRGYTVLARNVREAHNEIDFVAEDDTSLVFVEVKTRTARPGSPSRYGRPARAVDSGKRQRTVLAAEAYLREHPTGKQPRIDVVEVYLSHTADGEAQVTDIITFRNAFGAR